ncbi:ATP phosphoribosyltransferase regulatory subunit [Oceaniovalibus guishaninsula JLT2003]|uniref:ATP phosphoribosyltransferase regulatory subunit n=1 Tax=Oceaniovalibus guishaninsula JLT2003 TaxID=1231392 RepID=K2HBE2_9RHOB|nr:ATP phosphoribosyltransferase regulatory subunit [Oceaniovalibus guishaninsula]EKE44798.1 ATP phosphoribosyltransferase regulatory subunit [Oceaniovalibus guishaninsula JLT2003]
MTDLAEKAEAARFLAAFQAAGAQPVETDILQPAETLLDLYGEDIRGRAFTTFDPQRGEMMLRPDFTVPIVQMHMAGGADDGGIARYAYSGQVFRRQEDLSDRAPEYLQTGFELFGGDDPAAADAEVFALFHDLLAPLGLRIATGDTGLLMAAVAGLPVSDARRAALLRHIWRPRRFRALTERFSHRTRPRRPAPSNSPQIGLRSLAEVRARLAALNADADEPPLDPALVGLIDELLELHDAAPAVLGRLEDMAMDMPWIADAVDGLARRLDAMTARGIDVAALPFETAHGRATMEYYDGFVFSFRAPQRGDLPPVATGGRYDALTRVLGSGRAVRAVGGVIRPALTLLAAGRGASC